MRTRLNKPMPESPRIVSMVKSKLNDHGGTIIVPWSAFVFSTRDGRPYWPPTMEKGVRMLHRTARPLASGAGVTLKVEEAPAFSALFGAPGSFDGNDFTLIAIKDDGVIRHEVLHFVQAVGDNLIRLVKGDPTAFSKGGMRHRLGPADTPAQQQAYHRKFLASRGFGLYGGPKRRSASRGKGIESLKHYQTSLDAHSLHDMEFQTDSLNMGLDAADTVHAARITQRLKGPVNTALAKAVVERTGDRTKLMKPRRKQDFLRASYQRGAEALGISAELTPEVRRELGEKVAAAPKAAESVPPRTPPAPLPPAKAGYRVVRENVNGRPAFVIYKDGSPTGKYAFTEEKARSIMGNLR